MAERCDTFVLKYSEISILVHAQGYTLGTTSNFALRGNNIFNKWSTTPIKWGVESYVANTEQRK